MAAIVSPKLDRQSLMQPVDFSLPTLSEGGSRDDPVVRSMESSLSPYRYLDSSEPSLERTIAEHLGCDSASRLTLVQLLAEDLPPLHRDCRLSVCIPAAAHEEENYIRQTIEAFRSQTAPRDTWEIVLYLNHPFTDAAGNGISPDATMNELEKVRSENPDIHIHYFYLPMPREIATIGQARRLLHDVVALRSLTRDSDAKDHLMLRTDADIHSLSPQLIERYIEGFEAAPNLYGLAGTLSHPLGARRANPVLHFGAELVKCLVNFEQRENLCTYSAGANLAFRLSAYIKVGGFNVQRTMGEDIEFDARLQAGQWFFKKYLPQFASRHAVGIERKFEDVEIVVSSRRAQRASESGHASIEQWSIAETEFGVENRDVRRWKEEPHTCGAEVLNDPDLPRRLEIELNNTIDFFNTDRTRLGFWKTAAVLENEMGLVFGGGETWPIDYDKIGQVLPERASIRNIDEVLARLKSELFKDEQPS